MREKPKRITHSKVRPPRPRKPSGPVSWDEAVRQFNNHLIGPAECSAHTILRYGRELNRFKAWWSSDEYRKEEGLEPGSIQASDLRDYKEWLRTDPVDRGTNRQRTRRGSTVNSILAPLKSFLLWAELTGLTEEAPAMPKRVKAAPSERKAIALKDQKKLIKAVERGGSKRDMAMVFVFLDCGLRNAELCAMRWRDVILTRGRAKILIPHGKGDKEGFVDLSIRARRALLDLAGKHAVPADPVFVSRKKGLPITPRGVQNLFDRYGRAVGLKIHPHQCRHSCATDMLNRGHQLPAVQAAMRHGSYLTTLQYCHTSPEQVRKAVERYPDDDDAD